MAARVALPRLHIHTRTRDCLLRRELELEVRALFFTTRGQRKGNIGSVSIHDLQEWSYCRLAPVPEQFRLAGTSSNVVFASHSDIFAWRR